MLIKLSQWVGEEEIHGFKHRPAQGLLGTDTETTGTNPWGKRGVDRKVEPARPFFFSFCDPAGNESHVRCPVNGRTRAVHYSKAAREAIESFTADEDVAKVIHNAPFDLRQFRAAGFRVAGPIHCTQIRMHIIRPNELTFKLKPLCKKYLGMSADDEKMLKASVIAGRRRAKKRGWAITPGNEGVPGDYHLGDPDLLRVYGVMDAKRAIALFLAQEEYFEANAALGGIYSEELAAMTTLEGMESRGVALDEERLDELEAFYKAIIEEHSAVILEEAPDLNLRSNPQMTRFWFGERGYTPLRYSKNKKKGNCDVLCQHCKGKGCKVCQDTGKNPSADGDFLASIGVRHEVDDEGGEHLVAGDALAWAILHHQAARSMLDFVQSYRELACREDGELVLHPNYKQVGARTARMSCVDPNLQNVASDESGKKKVDVPYRSREVFVPRGHHRPGGRNGKRQWICYNPDYSQIEIWVLAILVFLKCKDRTMLDALARGGDAHQNVADLIWGHLYDGKAAKRDAKKDPRSLTPAQLKNLKAYKHSRKRAKNLQFCKIYGGGVGKIASMIGCSIPDAKKFMQDYDERLPSVAEFMRWCIAEAWARGEVVSPYGRVYPVDPGFEYRATNYLIQGTAADIMKRAMVRVDRLLRKRVPGKAHILLQIHDELMIEVHVSVDSPALRSAVVRAMAADYKKLGCPIPFPVGFKVFDDRWTEARDVEVDIREAA